MRKHFLYAVAFDGGLVKVGRSTSPHKRIGQHEDRLSCAGIQLLDRYIVECDGDAVLAEAALIERCAEAAMARRQREWFNGIRFSDVCEWVDEACAMRFEAMETDPLDAYLRPYGYARALARAVGVSEATVSQWRNGLKRPAPETCIRIEQATSGAVRCEDLRPDFNWAYLRGSAPAAPVCPPQEQTNNAHATQAA